MKVLPDRWIEIILREPETGMGYTIVTVLLRDGKRYERVVIDSGYITKVYGYDNIPFDPDDIVDIIVTHNKWDFDTDPLP